MRNIIITGGELFNKGAQAMTFVAVNELKKRFQDHEIWVLSEQDLRRKKEDREQYAFRFTGWFPIKFARAQKDPFLRLACKLKNGAELRSCEELYRNCDLMVDVSGYGLGSNFGPNQLTEYADHLEFAKAFGIPMVLMPQSFGPFDFRGEKKTISERIPELLRSARLICAREQEGYDELLREYKLDNVRLLPDLVLNNKEIDLRSLYRVPPVLDLPEIPEGSVGLIPNERIVLAVGEEAALELYRTAVERLLDLGRTVILLRHAEADKELCRKIRAMFPEESRIELLDRDFSCLEYNELVKRFRYVLASRFHAIVHAYKNGVPAIALGWALKYQELLKEFGQERYGFRVNDAYSQDAVAEAIAFLDAHAEEESEMILRRLKKIQKQNVFDVLNEIV